MKFPFITLPAIDLMQGRVVRLVQGDPGRRSVYEPEPAAAASRLQIAGASWLHLVDLDAAFGEPSTANRSAIADILALEGLNVQIGGGLRALDSVEQVLAAGAARAVLGTLPLKRPDLFELALRRFDPDRLAVALDVNNGTLRSHGWTVEQPILAEEYASQLADAGVTHFVYTDTGRDGTGAGLALEAARRIQRRSGVATIVSGGANTLEDVRAARAAGLAGVVVGKAVHDGRIDPKELFRC